MTIGARIGAATVRMRVPVMMVLVLVFAATGCGSEPGIDRQTVSAATVRVRADGCGPRAELGTGTVIPDGLVVTAAHVVAGAKRVDIVDRHGDTIASEVVMFDPDLDVAALRPVTDAGPSAPLRVGSGREGETGLVALVARDGSVEMVAIDVLQRVTIDTTDIYRDEAVQRLGLRVGVTVHPGDSGAMVHLQGGGVGIVWSRSTATSNQAWTVDLPSVLLASSTRLALVAPVDTGPCP